MKDPPRITLNSILIDPSSLPSMHMFVLSAKGLMRALFAWDNWILTVIQYRFLDNENVSSYLLSGMKITL